jgi:hypothetical protein
MLGNPDPAVAHDDAEAYRTPPALQAAHGEAHLAFRGELDGVAQEIDQDLPQPAGVAAQRRRYLRRDLHRELQALAARLRLEKTGDALEQVVKIEIDAIQLEPARLHTRQVEDVVDDREQRLAAVVHRLGVATLLVRKGRLEQEPGHAEDAVHRLPDLVAHRGPEQRLGLRRRPRPSRTGGAAARARVEGLRGLALSRLPQPLRPAEAGNRPAWPESPGSWPAWHGAPRLKIPYMAISSNPLRETRASRDHARSAARFRIVELDTRYIFL